ncbi:MAG: hypothetical protein ABSH52_32340 [Terriglobia bacterium]|jgi:hypothetical protein
MVKWAGTMALMAVLAVAFLTSCGSSKPKVTTPQGSITALVSDMPGPCDVVSFPFNITDLVFTGPGTNGQPQAGTVVINTGSVAEPEIRVNLGCLRDFSTPLVMTTANVGNYTLAQIYISEPSLIFYDPTILPPNFPINTAELTMQPLKLYEQPINPPLVIAKNAPSVIQIDFDMLHMIQNITTDPTNLKTQVSATPEITFTPITALGSQGQGFGELDDLVGFVRSVTAPPPVPLTQYNGSFTLQLLSASISSPPLATIYLNGSTQLYGFSNLNELYTDSFMEVDAYIDDVGNFVATSAEDEYTECLPSTPPVPPCYDKPILAIIGPVTSLTRDANGNVTSFNLWARDVEPNDPATVSLDSIPTVNVSSSTIYQYSSRYVNFANLPFGPSNINVGQEVIVHGQVTVPSASSGSGAPALPTYITAYKVYDKLQSIQGSFSALLQVADDDKTGAFTFTPCGVMFQNTPAIVLTNSQTNFVNLSGLSTLNGGGGTPTLLVKGLPFYEEQAQTIAGVPVPAGTMVILAKQVHRL